jgi:predicted AAA+ superfamily ATPase
MTLRHDGYRDRLLDGHLNRLLQAFGAVEIVGSMWCGKTWMAEAHGNSKVSLANTATKELIEADVDLAFQGTLPHVIDEWQEVPQIWDATRAAVDEAGGKRGMFILTGSTTPAKSLTFHSGTGRIARIHLRPMSLAETGESNGTVSLRGLFNGEFQKQQTETSLVRLANAICKGGWPGILTLDEASAKLVTPQYIDTFVSSTAQREGISEYRLQRLLISLARNIGQAVVYHTIAGDMVEGDQSNKQELIARQQVESLIGHLKDRFIIEDLGGWDAPVKSKSRVRVKPKRCFVDPSLPAALLGTNEDRLLGNMQLFGQLFEELCLRDLRIYASALDEAGHTPIRYYRDSDGLEVDAIIELRDGRWAAVEIKLSENKVEEGIANLTRLKKKILANPFAQNKEPSFMAVLVGKTDYCRKTADGIFVFPITALTA